MILPNQTDRVAVFFDMSNLYFVARDLGVRIDYSRLLEFLVAGRRLACAYAYVTLASEESSAVPFLTWLRRNGFRVVTRTLRRAGDGTLRGDLDLELAVDVLLQTPHVDVVVLVTGDGDYCYLVETVQRLGRRVEIASAPRNTAVELMELADYYVDLEANLRHFSQPRPPTQGRPESGGTNRVGEQWRTRPESDSEAAWEEREFADDDLDR
ncbi:NYN domain-containing protein [Thermomicrobium sp. CFH 73360]|uniref:LabA-like NYN domain-containing protein n=1 Tax=Thermomicrobium sp. CFH 73360 TaxID=2951987 RepID=UPI0020778E1A|nr:NYN domain-containing protein [Thermomicrobium sp. CFH 73360]MCM8745921.1 NYN domain-containing protein [Thermomicrobium sp. CFH 73360]